MMAVSNADAAASAESVVRWRVEVALGACATMTRAVSVTLTAVSATAGQSASG
jgi:hypothetical protein